MSLEVIPHGGSYLYFNGANTAITIPDIDNYSWTSKNALSVSVWMNPEVLLFGDTEGSGYVHFLSKLDFNANEWTFRMYSSDNSEGRANRISFYIYSADGLPLGDGVAFQDTIIPGEWIHLVATVDSNKQLKMYKNAVLRNTATSALSLSNTITPVRIGSGAQNANPNNRSYFQGSIYNVQIYNRVLSQNEISNLYAHPDSAMPGLVSGWLLTDGVGSTAKDYSDTANDGVIANGTWSKRTETKFAEPIYINGLRYYSKVRRQIRPR